MGNNGNVICSLRFKCKVTLFWIIVSLSLIALLGPVLSVSISSNRDKVKFLSGIPYAEKIETYNDFTNSWETHDRFFPVLLVSGIIMTIILLSLPLIVVLIKKYITKRCELILTDKEIRGQKKTLFSMRRLQIPIDHLDNVMTSNSLIDKIRGGETLMISSNSGLIRFHYVQNAEEFAQAAMKRIDEVRRSVPRSGAPMSAPAPVQSVSGSDAIEKINALRQMLDSGLITQEDFDKKKSNILSKM